MPPNRALQRQGSTLEGERGPCCSFTNNFDSLFMIDLFAKKPELRLPSGSTRYTSLTGCLCSLAYIAAVVLFGLLTIQDLIDKSVVTTRTKVDKNYWDPMGSFTNAGSNEATRDFQIAFGVAQPGYPNDILDSKVGTLKAYYKTWDFENEEAGAEPKYVQIDDAACTPEQLGMKQVDSTKSSDSDDSKEGEEKTSEETVTDEEKAEGETATDEEKADDGATNSDGAAATETEDNS